MLHKNNDLVLHDPRTTMRNHVTTLDFCVLLVLSVFVCQRSDADDDDHDERTNSAVISFIDD
jgi:hypothetical protein